MNRNWYESIITWFAHNNVAANLLMVCLLAGGLFTALTIKKESQPSIETNFININMPYRGASPQDVEEGIIIKIEEAIQDIEGLEEIVSSAREGSGSIFIEVAPDYDVLEVMDKVKTRVDAISTFPAETEKPVVSRQEFQQQVMWISVYGDVNERTLKEFAKQTRNQIVSLPGVTRAEIAGSRSYEISIEVSEERLQQFGLTLAEVTNALRRGSVDLPAGSIRTDAGSISVRAKGQAYTGTEFEDIVIRTNPDGSRLLVQDVAEVKDAFEDRERYAQHNGKPAIAIQVLSVGNQSELEISQTVRNWVDQQQANLPSGINIAYWADITYYLEGRLNMMMKNLLFGAILVFASLTLFLRMKLAFWVMLGLPIAFMGAFFVMPAMGVTINLISLFGFILVLGIVVDDAIVIGESAYTNIRAKGHSEENVVEGVLKVAVPATFGVLTTIAAFMPILMVGGIMGQFFAAIGWVVVLCLAFSLVESKLILPAHLAHMKVKPRGQGGSNFVVRFQRKVSDGLHAFVDRYYVPLLEKTLKRPYLTVSIFVAALILSIGLVTGGLVRFVVFPDFESDFIEAQLVMNDGTPSRQTQAAMDYIQQGLIEVDREISAEHGMESGAVVKERFAFARSETRAQAIVQLIKEENSIVTAKEVLRRWREKVGTIPGAQQLTIGGADDGPGGGAAISFRLVGQNIDQLARAAAALENKIRSYEGVYDVRNSFEGGRPEFKLTIKPEAEALGLTQQDLARQVRAGFYGDEVQRIQRGQDEVRVMVRYPKSERDSIGYLEQMRIRTPAGDAVPFSSVANVEIANAPTFIRRYDRARAIRVSAEVDKEKYEPGKITKDLREGMNELLSQFPGVRYRLDGASESERKLLSDLTRGALFALFLIYALMAIPLRSYMQPLIIMSVIPFGVIGAIIGHWVGGITVSMLSLFGIIALSGVVVNDSLILVDFVNRSVRKGVDTAIAARDAARVRFRPILLTSLTTFLGLAPIVFFESSLQAKIVQPMAAALAFGIVFATAITLFLIPCMYLILSDFIAFVRRLFGKSQNAPTGEPSTHSVTGVNDQPLKHPTS